MARRKIEGSPVDPKDLLPTDPEQRDWILHQRALRKADTYFIKDDGTADKAKPVPKLPPRRVKQRRKGKPPRNSGQTW